MGHLPVCRGAIGARLAWGVRLAGLYTGSQPLSGVGGRTVPSRVGVSVSLFGHE